MIQDASAGQRKGVTYDLGTELAKRLGVPFEPVVFQRVAEVVDALKSGQVDFTITNASPARVKDLDFTPTVLDLELGYLVLSGSPVSALASVDRPGIRVGVSEGSTSLATLSREFKNATVVTAPSLKSAMEMLSQKTIDAFATNKAILFEMSDELPNSRVLDGRWGWSIWPWPFPEAEIPRCRICASSPRMRSPKDWSSARSNGRGYEGRSRRNCLNSYGESAHRRGPGALRRPSANECRGRAERQPDFARTACAASSRGRSVSRRGELHRACAASCSRSRKARTTRA